MKVFSVEELEEIIKLPPEQQKAIFEERRKEAEEEFSTAVEATQELGIATTEDVTIGYLFELVKEANKGNLEALNNIKSLCKDEETKELFFFIMEFQKLQERYGDGPLTGILKQGVHKKKNYRTAAKAGDIIDKFPEVIASITLPTYNNAMSLNPNGNAYLSQLPTTDGLRFDSENGKMYFDTAIMPITEAQLQDIKTKENISDIDLPLLRSFYSILLAETQEKGKRVDIVTLRLPDLAKYLGLNGNMNELIVNSILSKVQKFHNIVGLIKGNYGESIFPVLNFEGYDKDKNTISFSSPYMNYVIEKIFGDLSVRRDTKGNLKLKKNGEPLRVASHSYAIKSDLAKERNKNASENVFIIVNTIEQAGGKNAHIAASTLVERNVLLKEALKKSSNKHQLLSRCFKKTWELLRTKTRLTEIYPGIELPDPNDPAMIPTEKTLNTLVFSFKHKGKKKL